MLEYLHDDYTVLAICVERSLVNTGLIATVAYKHSNYSWACKTGGGISSDMPDKQLVAAVFKYGFGVEKEVAEDTFKIEKDYRYVG